MSYLLDANAFLYLIRQRNIKIKDQYILDLTIYETGNAIWKEHALFKSITLDEALKLMINIQNIVSKMKVIRIQKDLDKILEIAFRKHLTFYDAAYLYFAKKYNLTLVTNDSKLYDSAKDEEIEVLKSSEFQE
nr:type II toxin-antitoxin system VapC family toxin [Candidatus Baldrarchaeota archaeon]